jgi:DNA-binding CsgD family transcriptional regulator
MKELNPWNLTALEQQALDAITVKGSTKAAARGLGIDPKKLDNALLRVRTKMNAPSTLLAAVRWDRHVRGQV